MMQSSHSTTNSQTTAAFLIGRLVVGGFYLYAGLDNLLHLNEKVGYVAYKGTPFPLLAVIIASILLMIGGVSILTGYHPTLGVGAVILFLAPVTLLMHNFWTVTDPQMQRIEMHAFLGNVALIGSALLVLAIPQPRPWSVDSQIAALTSRVRKAVDNSVPVPDISSTGRSK
jgi:putative oxidoreductase